MTDRYKEIINNFISWGKTDDKLYAALILGSQARDAHTADEYSDLDIVLVVDEPEYFITTDKWLNDIGTFHVSFVENTLDGLKERRVLFDNALDVDIIIRPKDTIDKIAADEAAFILSNGYKILIDKIGLQEKIQSIDKYKHSFSMLSEQDFINTVNDFWYHSVWTAKKLKRGEMWTAKFCLDSYMKWKLLSIIECHAHAIHGLEYNTWYGGRFIEEWAEKWIIEKLSLCFSHYNSEDIKAALLSTMDLFRILAIEYARKCNFHYPKEADEYVSSWVATEL